ncbi:unnamed protein product [Onchocerca flexuosa]|uniref:Iwr1 domain-containing protein n=1 Tax=Onchocerca flexuosa TaxID=387005 RepID=A0A183HWL8_9BILA|nr:unnamed protein product [Onchocerca flexuosa]
MLIQTGNKADDPEDIVDDDEIKDSSSSHSHSSEHEGSIFGLLSDYIFSNAVREQIQPGTSKCAVFMTADEVKDENALDHDDLEQCFETTEKIGDDHINAVNMDDEEEMTDTNHERNDDDSDKDEDKQAGPSRPRRIMLSSDEEDNIDTAPAAPKSR